MNIKETLHQYLQHIHSAEYAQIGLSEQIGDTKEHKYIKSAGRKFIVIDKNKDNDQLGISSDKSKAASLKELTQFVIQKLPGLTEKEQASVRADFKIIAKEMSKFHGLQDLTDPMLLMTQYLSPMEQVAASEVTDTWNADLELEIKAKFKSDIIGKDFWQSQGIEVGEEPPLPENWFEKLKSSSTIDPSKAVIETDMVVMISKEVNGKPTTVRNFIAIMEKIMFRPVQDPFKVNIWDGILAEHGDTKINESFWLRMTKVVLPGTPNEPYASQVAKVQGLGYDVSKLLPSLIGICAQFLKTGVTDYGRNPWMETRCREKAGGYQTCVGGLGSFGLNVSISSFAYDFVGMAGQGKF